MSYLIEGDNVYYGDDHITRHIGPVNKTETIRIDDNTVADVTYQFDLAAGEYVELSRVTRAEPLPPVPETDKDKIARIEAENQEQNLQIIDLYENLISKGVL